MKILTKHLSLKNDDQLFDFFMSSLKLKGITQYDYFIKWEKVEKQINRFEKEINLLNVLIGKPDVHQELTNLILEYPQVIDAIPLLLAIRFNKKADQQLDILKCFENFEYERYDFSIETPTAQEASKISDFFIKTGLGDLVSSKKIKNLMDYATGLEAGLDSNGRKNRGGHQMERIVEYHIKALCETEGLEYLKEANAAAIKKVWGIQIQVDKSSRRIDYVIKKDGQLYFIEVNFYGGGGSKLKSTATEYKQMNQYWNAQGITFIWITDGAGWLTAQKPLREYFDKAEYLLNLEMLTKGFLKKIL